MGFYVSNFARNVMRDAVDPARMAKAGRSAAKKVEQKLEPAIKRMAGESLQLTARPATNRVFEILKEGLK